MLPVGNRQNFAKILYLKYNVYFDVILTFAPFNATFMR